MTTRRVAPRYLACVIDDREVFQPGGGRVAFAGPPGTRPKQYQGIPAGLLYNPGSLFALVSQTLGGEGVVIVPRVPVQLVAKGGPVCVCALLVDQAAKGGWTLRGQAPDVESDEHECWAWWTFDNAGDTLHMGVRPLIDQDATPLFPVDGLPDVIAGKLAEYHERTGTPWRMTPGVAGCAAIRDRWARSLQTPYAKARRREGERVEPLWRQSDPHTEHDIRAHGAFNWTRVLLDNEQGWPIHQYDISAQYLAAAMVAMLPYSPLEHTGERAFDPRVAGHWLMEIEIPDFYTTGAVDLGGNEIAGGMVPLVRIFPRDDGLIPLSTPIAAYLAEKGVKGKVIDSFTAEISRPWLRPWAESLRDQLYRQKSPIRHTPSCTDDECVPGCMVWALKATYNQTIGMIGKDGGSIHSRAAREMIVDTARVNQYRKMSDLFTLTGFTPVRVYHDSAYYALPEANRPELDQFLKAERAPGKFRYIKTRNPVAA